jgi:hypothetical protein
MRNRHQRIWTSMLRAAALGIVMGAVAALSAACSAGPAPALPAISEGQMKETLERVLEMGPQLLQQLEDIEKLSPGTGAGCASSYPERCIPPPPPRLTCQDIGLSNFLVLPPDPHHFDPDQDGIGCEE